MTSEGRPLLSLSYMFVWPHLNEQNQLFTTPLIITITPNTLAIFLWIAPAEYCLVLKTLQQLALQILLGFLLR